MARDLDPFKLSSPRIFLVRMMVFLILCGLIVVVLHMQLVVAFMANPGLNALIIAALVIGILLSFRQVSRLVPGRLRANGFPLSVRTRPALTTPVFGLGGPLALVFLGLQAGQAQNRFYMELEDWLSTVVSDLTLDGSEPRALVAPSGEMRSAIDKPKEAVADTGSNRAAPAAMANLAEAIHGLVSHMRTAQQMIRDWADAQAAQSREMNRPPERIAGEEPRKDELRKTVR